VLGLICLGLLFCFRPTLYTVFIAVVISLGFDCDARLYVVCPENYQKLFRFVNRSLLYV